MKPRHIFVVLFLSILIPSITLADPCLVVYPSGPCVYKYDVMEYYRVGPGHPLYDAGYDRGGYVLLEVGTDEIDESIYQAPGLIGFEPSVEGNDGYIIMSKDFELILNGFSNVPRTFYNIQVVFDKVTPEGCVPDITVDGMPVSDFCYQAGDLAVSTPTANGNNYSDTMTLNVDWYGCYGLHIWAYSDMDNNGSHDGDECFTAFSHDTSISTKSSSWGAVKALYTE